MQTITLPKRSREGSFTDADLDDTLKTLAELEDPREAVVVGTGFDSESSARNRARLMATALHDRDQRLYSSHAIKASDGTWIGAVSVRSNQEPPARPERGEDDPSLRDLQAAARYHEIKGRSKMDYDALVAAITEADPGTPIREWKGYGKRDAS